MSIQTVTTDERNAMLGKVEQYDVINNPPETLVAYVGKPNGGATYPITTWTGDILGYATKGATWRVNSYIGSHMSQFYARIAGREYTGRGFGAGLSIVLRETAQSKRARSNQWASARAAPCARFNGAACT